ncbi:predicted protein [Uncinocarpus reesii 1704]|uniref:G1/S-specific cyclin Pcl5 n=1 Tax=Uncinocarpus reesii (strain UAMH 1704) TaxID=336963 RepID=C4JP94_UNCRE|nr:uncharacterized protein UREG_04476 [Uncinocarpus reesii 1704]EEP79630.1 predicted protein [Uncinocarpus reesii 1704]
MTMLFACILAYDPIIACEDSKPALPLIRRAWFCRWGVTLPNPECLRATPQPVVIGTRPLPPPATTTTPPYHPPTTPPQYLALSVSIVYARLLPPAGAPTHSSLRPVPDLGHSPYRKPTWLCVKVKRFPRHLCYHQRRACPLAAPIRFYRNGLFPPPTTRIIYCPYLPPPPPLPTLLMDTLDFNFVNPYLQHALPRPYPYASSIASSASSSSSSVFSLDSLSSQSSSSSISSSSIDVIWENDENSGQGRCPSVTNQPSSHCPLGKSGYGKVTDENTVAPDLRRHPRRVFRTANADIGKSCPRQPPPLVRASHLRFGFVDRLVDSAAQIVEIIWPLAVEAARSDSTLGCKGVLPLRSFIRETLRRSRTSYSTLQVALYYLILIKQRIPSHNFTMEQPHVQEYSRAMQCGRRMFLSALILASKYLQDRNYSARAWSKISGLSTTEINQNELIFLQAVGWRLHISEPVFQRWTDIVLRYTPSSDHSFNGEGLSWKTVIPSLTPELDNVDLDNACTGPVAIQDLLPPIQTLSPTSSPDTGCRRRSLAANQVPTCDRKFDAQISHSAESQPILLPNPLKLGVLPTPQMSPQSLSNNTPAASVLPFTARGPSMTSAMRQAQNMCAQRTTLDQRPPLQSYPVCTRRSSLARSSTSSPDSMISDVPSLTSSRSSRSSRSSSISSVASGTCAPTLPRLATRATRRCASTRDGKKTFTIASPIDERSCSDIFASPEPMSASSTHFPDLAKFSLDASVDMAHEAAQSLCELSVAVPRSNKSSALRSPCRSSRKRGRTSSNDMDLQHKVRHLMALDYPAGENNPTFVLPDVQPAESFLLSETKTEWSSSGCSFGSRRPFLPLPFATDRVMERPPCPNGLASYLWNRSSSESVADMLD